MTDDDRVLDLDAIVAILADDHGVKSYVEMTGGGTATIYAGDRQSEDPESDGWYKFEACAGPGWFEGPNYTLGRAAPEDFAIGPDDDAEAAGWMAFPEDGTERDAATMIAKVVRAARGEIKPDLDTPRQSG